MFGFAPHDGVIYKKVSEPPFPVAKIGGAGTVCISAHYQDGWQASENTKLFRRKFHEPRKEIYMIRKIALVAAAGIIAASAASAQTPAPGNVNPGSMKSGAEQSGAENQPRSPGNERGRAGTTGSGMSGSGMTAPRTTNDPNGTNATTNPASKESGSEPAGEAAPMKR